MKEKIVIITEGDASLASTWSNVPFFLTETLKKQGYNIEKVNISVCKIIPRIISKIIKIFVKNSTYDANRTRWYTKRAEHKMKQNIKKHSDAQLFIVTNFSYSPYLYTDKPILLFSDWTYEYYIRYFKSRKPDAFEKKEIARQNQQIENTSCIITLFPQVCEYMKEYYKNKNIYYLGNVINTIEKAKEEDIEKKVYSNKLLFIGNKKYIEAARTLIEAFQKCKDKNIELHIIGLSKEQLKCEDKKVFLYGYLNKNRQEEKEIYDRLMREAKVCINTNEKWAGFSSIIECMYFFTPVITTPYKEFVQTFGEDIEFGYYCKENQPERIKEKIETLFQLPEEEYRKMCISANEKVKNFTWERYTSKMLELLRKNKEQGKI